MYDPKEYSRNVANGYMVKTKSNFLGFLFAFGGGPLGTYFYWGHKEGWKMLKMYFGMIGFGILSFIFPLFAIGSFCYGLGILAQCLGYLVDEWRTHKLTPAGEIEHEKWLNEAPVRKAKRDEREEEKKRYDAAKKIVEDDEKRTRAEQERKAEEEKLMKIELIAQNLRVEKNQSLRVCTKCSCKSNAELNFCGNCGHKFELVA